MWIDSHTHLQDPILQQDLASILARAREVGVERFILSGVDPEDWVLQDQMILKASAWGIASNTWLKFNGLHPWKVNSANQVEIDLALQILGDRLTQSSNQIIGIGEIGIDCGNKNGARSKEDLTTQISVFKKQFEMAQDLNLPVILHVVKAHGAVLEYLNEIKFKKTAKKAGIVHAYSGGTAVARAYVQMGFLVSIGPMILKKGYEQVKAMVKDWPLSSLVLETDCPWMGTELNRPGEPADLLLVAEGVAQIRGKESATEILNQSTQNLAQLFGL